MPVAVPEPDLSSLPVQPAAHRKATSRHEIIRKDREMFILISLLFFIKKHFDFCPEF